MHTVHESEPLKGEKTEIDDTFPSKPSPLQQNKIISIADKLRMITFTTTRRGGRWKGCKLELAPAGWVHTGYSGYTGYTLLHISIVPIIRQIHITLRYTSRYTLHISIVPMSQLLDK